MDGTPFASLAQIRVLLLPVGTIRRSVFEKYSGLVRSIEQIRLGDIPPDPREDRNRFLPSPLSAGYLHLYYTSHPPSAWHHSLSLLRLSSFPLAVIGIADCSQKDSISSLGAEFKATLSRLFSGSSATPFATKCFAFEDGDAIPDVNVGSSMPELVMIPSLMSNKQVYIGTLLAELCHDILAEFPSLIRAIDNSEGLDALSNSFLPSLSKYVDGSGYFVHGSHRPSNGGIRHSAPSSVVARSSAHSDTNGKPSRSSTPGPSTNGVVTPSASGSFLAISTSKKRASAPGPSNGRLAKIVGDLYLLAGKLSDASYWYTEAITLFRTQQDSIWNASALEGQCVLEMLEAWSLGDSLHTSLGGNTLADPWANISDKMGQAINVYSRATPMNPAPLGIPDPELASIVFLYVEAILRHGRMQFAVWSGKGWNPLSLSTMLSSKLPQSFTPDPPRTPTFYRLTSITNITRSQISTTISQAHGPFLLHLQPSDRIQVLTSLAALYSCIGFKRKEVFVLREVQAAVMDLVVCGREESRNAAPSPRPATLNSEFDGVSPVPQNILSIRRTESTQGNPSVIRIARYIAQVYGIDLCRVGVADPESRRRSSVKSSDAASTLPHLAEGDARYGWPELQVGVVREALAMAEGLPDHLAVAQFSLSTLRELRDYITGQEQQHLSASANRAISIGRRRGLFHSMQLWFDDPLLSIALSPMPFSRIPSEHQRGELRMSGTSAVIRSVRGPFIYDPRGKKSTALARLVQNESIEFFVTLRNPFMFDLEVSSIVLSTSGMQCHSQPLSATVPASSIHTLALSLVPLEPGQLTIRGCHIQLPGGISHECTFGLPPESTSNRMPSPPLRISHSPYDAERIKFAGLEANHLLRPSPDAPSEANSAAPQRFLQYQVVAEQPMLRIRRSSIVQGTLMLYEGETSEIRLTLENISNTPVDFYRLSFDDSTIGPAQQLLADGELSVADAYETEYDLVYRPFFTWTAPDPMPVIVPGKRTVMSVKCHGKVGCSQGTIQLSYSYINRWESDVQQNATDTFYARQIVYPVNVTVYHTLELSNLDIIPLSSASSTSRPSSHIWTKPLLDIQSDQGNYCLVSMDVSNIYGLPFDVTFERYQEGTASASITRTVAPGCTSRLFLPLKRIMLQDSVSSSAIPMLSDRQFVVAKDKLSEEAELLQRELFWYREKLVELLKARWLEPGTGRMGTVSLRGQRFTLPMRNALRKEVFPIDVSFTPSSPSQELPPDPSIAVRKGKEWHVKLYEMLRMVVNVRNECPSSKTLMMSVATVPPTPPEYALFDGKLTHNFLGTLPASSSDNASEDVYKSKSLGVCFVAEGVYDILVEVTEVDENGLPLPLVEKNRTTQVVKVIVSRED